MSQYDTSTFTCACGATVTNLWTTHQVIAVMEAHGAVCPARALDRSVVDALTASPGDVQKGERT